MPELELIKGPLTEGQLAKVAALYGKTDGKYSNQDHCRLLFNESPFGSTLHAFAKDGESYVGHYCLIPYDLLINGKVHRAAKGEALHVEADYRRTKCGEHPTSSALLLGAQQLADQENIGISYAIVGAPGVIRLFERCGYHHRPFEVLDHIVPSPRALSIFRVARLKAAVSLARLSCREDVQSIGFEEMRDVSGSVPGKGWQSVLNSEVLKWFSDSPANRFFRLGQAAAWLTQTHSDWEVLCTFSKSSNPNERTCFAMALREEATRQGIDRIRLPEVGVVEEEMRTAFAPLTKKKVEREVSFVVRGVDELGEAVPSPFLWSHF